MQIRWTRFSFELIVEGRYIKLDVALDHPLAGISERLKQILTNDVYQGYCKY